MKLSGEGIVWIGDQPKISVSVARSMRGVSYLALVSLGSHWCGLRLDGR